MIAYTIKPVPVTQAPSVFVVDDSLKCYRLFVLSGWGEVIIYF
jgi:hypothetical protein